MSDSLNATVIVSVLVLTISMKPVEDDDELLLEPPRLPALVEPALELELDPELELELPVLEPLPDTALPRGVAWTETTVPPAGA
jgi:hypothetical protein